MTYRSIARLILSNRKNRTKNVRLRKMGYAIYLLLAMVYLKCGELQKQILSDWSVMIVRVAKITGYVDDKYGEIDTINEHIKNLESKYAVRVISIDVNEGGASEFGRYSV